MLALKIQLRQYENHVNPEEYKALDFTSGAVTIGLKGEDTLRGIQLAARKLVAIGLTEACLVGVWSREQQYAFLQSFVSPSANRTLHFSEASCEEDKVWLEQHKKALLFLRTLVNATPEQLSPENLAYEVESWLKSLAPEHISVRTWVGDALQQAQYNGIYHVGRGSDRPPVLLELDYNPSDSKQTDLALVGKGITFDSGGYSMKSSEGMLDMKCDMGGAATVTCALGLAIMQGLNKRVKLYLCCAENLVSGHAYKLGDVIQYKNGTTVEIVNTDAEGRLVLADGLLAASENNPDLIVDAATLTGAAVTALGSDYNAVFSMSDELSDRFIAGARAVNEAHWRLPLGLIHQTKCPSPFADTANSRPQKGGGSGGASNAAGFLSRFVGQHLDKWLHLDLSAAYNRNGSDTMPEGATGIGMRAITEILKNA
ncbi:aminopeptidase PepB [Agaribacter flavus]|uniref:Aminopeptidase PepB n=1 Tax=Agaribacter flavus TaxID=1902781 RepID=A0ABV7FRS2_9ALTE